MLSFLGTRWGTGEKPRFSDDDAIRFSRMLFDAGGAISWDVPIQRNGTISQPFIDQLNVIGKSMRELAATRPASSQP
jgi:protein involved in polysaccharide export with SLBB domain